MGQGSEFIDDATQKNFEAVGEARQRTSVVEKVSNEHTQLVHANGKNPKTIGAK